MTDTAKQSGIALEKAYQFMLWLMPTVSGVRDGALEIRCTVLSQINAFFTQHS